MLKQDSDAVNSYPMSSTSKPHITSKYNCSLTTKIYIHIHNYTIALHNNRDQIKACILALKERSGSSLQAIKKFLGASPAQYRFINAALRSGVASGFFVKNKGKYKLSAEAKKRPKEKKEKEEEKE